MAPSNGAADEFPTEFVAAQPHAATAANTANNF
jgi:hypothetical protein